MVDSQKAVFRLAGSLGHIDKEMLSERFDPILQDRAHMAIAKAIETTRGLAGVIEKDLAESILTALHLALRVIEDWKLLRTPMPAASVERLLYSIRRAADECSPQLIRCKTELSAFGETIISKLFPEGPLDDPILVDLVVLLDKENESGKSMTQITREFAAKYDLKPQSLLRKIRKLRAEGKVKLKPGSARDRSQ